MDENNSLSFFEILHINCLFNLNLAILKLPHPNQETYQFSYNRNFAMVRSIYIFTNVIQYISL